ncbi:testis-expressed protein 49-like [Erpetoichthys calabaricus]|uniref:testis-expressed protein 49-like n=1 Tax=Erpetoichthys calabaricus TaxID=27687 RepID=UPI0010A0981E|nr:testis-expressed protein 49-like [Erpetoichthys calabaricus]
MAFFGITGLGYQNPFRGSARLEGQGAGAAVPSACLLAPGGGDGLRGSEGHGGSQQTYRDMVLLARIPKSPNELSRVPITEAQHYGWWLCKESGHSGEMIPAWARVNRHPRKDSEMTRFVNRMVLSDRDFHLF